MTQEEKQLLLIDLCARLPYRVKCADFAYDKDGNSVRTINILETIFPSNQRYIYINVDSIHNISRIKPYLRPMSSMTKEERKEWQARALMHPKTVFADKLDCLIDWLNEHHFDYRGLIEKGLALEAPTDMYKTE